MLLEKSVADNVSQTADHEVVYRLFESRMVYHFQLFDFETEERYLRQVIHGNPTLFQFNWFTLPEN